MQASLLISAVIALTTAAIEPVLAAPDRAFGARTIGQLLEACAMSPDNPTHREASQFCHGFALGVLARQPAGKTCALSSEWRDTLAGYAAWAHANPIHLDDNPAHSLVEFLDLHGQCQP